MRASEWQYLCAVHDPPKPCCAIDYCCHTLDWASSILTSQKHFPSRLTLGSESTGGTQQGVRQLTNIFRRVYRIFAHAWFQHRQVFWQVESYEGLYIFFKTVCDFYALIPEGNYTIPPEAEGIVEITVSERDQEKRRLTGLGDEEHGHRQMTILKKEDESISGEDTDTTTTISTGATTRRHKHTPSTGSAVTTIAEGDEEEKEHKARKERELSPDTTVRPAGEEEEDDDEGETEEEAETIPALTGEELAALISKSGAKKNDKHKDQDDANAEHEPKSDPAPNHETEDEAAVPAFAPANDIDPDVNTQIHTQPPPTEHKAKPKEHEIEIEEKHSDAPAPAPTHNKEGTETAAEAEPSSSVSEEDAASAVQEDAENCTLGKVEG